MVEQAYASRAAERVRERIEHYGQVPCGWDKNAVLHRGDGPRPDLLEALENDRPLARTELEVPPRDVNRQGRAAAEEEAPDRGVGPFQRLLASLSRAIADGSSRAARLR